MVRPRSRFVQSPFSEFSLASTLGHGGMGLQLIAETSALPRAVSYGDGSYPAKRVLDILLAAIALLITLPVWAVIAVAIKLNSPGPVLFSQTRVGLNGRLFRFYKFRSMVQDAELKRQELLSLNEVDGPVFKLRRDPRITRVGAVLRRTSLDELPQLFNVLKGDMSLVGPRPPLPSEVEKYRPTDMVRLRVVPGITCLWQVSGRSNTSFDQWMELDREYVSNMSFLLDLKILWRTVSVVATGIGAY
jgi:exopolysaccharide biosynthesis polyprenyl glycosylphosphotransferase